MSLDIALANEALRRATVELITMSLPLGSLVLRYVGLFRPARNRISPDRMAKLIGQLVPDMQRGAITHKGRDWAMPTTSWRAGLDAMLERAAADKLTLPLENHNYLYTVLAGLADKVEARQEEADLVAARQRSVAGPAPQPQSIAKVLTGMPEHIKRQVEAIKRGQSIKDIGSEA